MVPLLEVSLFSNKKYINMGDRLKGDDFHKGVHPGMDGLVSARSRPLGDMRLYNSIADKRKIIYHHQFIGSRVGIRFGSEGP